MQAKQMTDEIRPMFEAARDVAKNAYAPYSKFHVGAAVSCEDGDIITGCNVENASYGLTVCAERNAIATAVAQGKRNLTGVVVYTPLDKILAPCGACRQVIAEFMAPDAKVTLTNARGEFESWTVEQLLPAAFTPAALNEK
jgi:cytidine deaminase